MTEASRAFKVLAYLFLLAVVIQFFLAGLGAMGGESYDAHVLWGRAALFILPLLMFGAAIAARLDRAIIIMVGVAFVLIILQTLLSLDNLEPGWIRALHVVNGLAVYVIGHHIVQRMRRPSLGGGEEA